MIPRGVLSKIGSFISLPAALLLLIFFFLPWVNLTCSTPMGEIIMGSSSGLQLTTGSMSPANTPMPMKGMNEGQQQPSSEAKEKQQKDTNEAISARPWFILGLLIPLALLAVGGSAARDRMEAQGASKALIVLGVIGVILMILAATVDFSGDIIEKQEKEQKAQIQNQPQNMNEAMSQMQAEMEKKVKESIKTKATGILWFSLVLYVLVIGCGVLNLVLPNLGAALAGEGTDSQSPPLPPSPGEGSGFPPR